MIQSLNSKIDITEKGTSFHGLTTYGKIMVGNGGFEFYNDRNVNDYIQIPWEEIDYFAASVMGKRITRFMIRTKRNGDFSFSAKNNKAVLRACNLYMPDDKMLRSLSLVDVIKRKFGIGKKK